MPHELEGQLHWHEPAGLSPAGVRRYARPPRAHDRFMAEEAIPVLRAAAVPSLLAVERGAWRRLGGRGAFLQLFGTEGALGCCLIEVPAGGALRAEKHLCEEVLLVLEGCGTTELWLDNDSERVVFEWQPGSLFAIPPNALHRFVNAGSGPALLLSGSNLPAVLNQLGDIDAVFANSFAFRSRFDDDTGRAFDDIEPDATSGLALCRTSLLPDALNCDLPLDNRPSPGYRQMALGMTGEGFRCGLGEHRPGRYSRGHLLAPSSVVVCLRGVGYVLLWPERAGAVPTSEVVRVELDRFAMFGAGPGGGRWYHQVFNTGKTPLRLLSWSVPDRPQGPPGEEERDEVVVELADGGTMIPYWMEAPQLRLDYAAATAINRMRPDDYQAPNAI